MVWLRLFFKKIGQTETVAGVTNGQGCHTVTITQCHDVWSDFLAGPFNLLNYGKIRSLQCLFVNNNHIYNNNIFVDLVHRNFGVKNRSDFVKFVFELFWHVFGEGVIEGSLFFVPHPYFLRPLQRPLLQGLTV